MQNIIKTAGHINNPMTQERLVAISKNKDNPIIPKHTIDIPHISKIATSFGITTSEYTLRKHVSSQKLNTTDKIKALNIELDTQLKSLLGHVIVPVDNKRLSNAKDIRDTLSPLWSTDITKTNSDDDQYIDGLHSVSETKRNPTSGFSGVRIRFK